MPDAINKVRFLIMGKTGPASSKFKGRLSVESIFGSDGLFEYSTRYAKQESDKDFDYDTLFDYSGRYANNKFNFTMSSDGKLDTREKMEVFKNKGRQVLSKDGTILWEFIFSPKDITTSEKYNLSKQSDYAAVISKIMPTYLKQIGFDPNNVSWWQDYHPENRTSIEPHPHIHLFFFENIQDRIRGKLQKKDLNLFKRLMANEMIKRQDRTKYNDLLSNINLNKKMIIDYSKRFDISKVDSIKKLYKTLPSTGRLQYNSANMIRYRKAIDKIVFDLLTSDGCKEMWNSYINSLNNYENIINTINGTNVSTRKATEINKLKVEIANYILSQKKNFVYTDKISSSLSKFKNKRQSIHNANTIKISNAPKHFRKFINGALAQRQREIEREIEEFVENIKRQYER